MDEKNTTTPEASQEESQEEANTEETTEESNEESSEESQEFDYKSELEALQQKYSKKEEQLSKAEHTIESIKRESKRAPKETDIEKMVEDIINQRMGGVEKTALEVQAKQLAESVSRNNDEAELVLWHYKNTIVPSGNLQTDIENAQMIANRKRFMAEFEEARRSFNAPKPGKAGSSGQKKTSAEAPKLSPKEASFIQSANMKWNPKSKRYEGKHVALQFNEQTEQWQSIRIDS